MADMFDNTLVNIEANPKTELLFTLSADVARLVEHMVDRTRLEGVESERDEFNDSDTPLQQKIMSAIGSDLLLLLETLWQDRTLFLQAMRNTYTPGLAGVFFIILRQFICSEFRNNPPSRFHITCFLKIFRRYLLVATSDQLFALAAIYNFTERHYKSEAGSPNPELTDLEDAEAMLEAYMGRLAPQDRRLYGPLHASLMPVLLEPIVPLIHPTMETSLPILFTQTLNRIWDAIAAAAESPRELVDSTGGIIGFFRDCITTFQSHHDIQPTVLEDMLKALATSDMLELLGKGLAMLIPAEDEDSADFSDSFDVLHLDLYANLQYSKY
ncbi:unnamed protein product [Rhizoctonia solani]|uniref:Uncharacterized protein n=1 Tax=Rhizoctonia solani TaxID=456999 RepID=A0A8H3HWZ8_9AGAM|nr:unnamed protein product [Rhizoctonia solani]